MKYTDRCKRCQVRAIRYPDDINMPSDDENRLPDKLVRLLDMENKSPDGVIKPQDVKIGFPTG